MDKSKKQQFLKAYDEHADAIYRHIFFRVFSSGRAEELLQEAYLRLWQYMKDGNKVENIRAFLYRVANNLVIDDVRKKKEESLDAMMAGESKFDPSYAGHKDVEQAIMAKEVIAAMRDLPEESRRLLTLRYVDDLDPKDIAELMDITPNNVSVKLNRAMKALRAHLDSKDRPAT